MIEVSIKEMMDVGAHFGHQTRRWNPKMKPYLYGVRSGIHIIDLQQTQPLTMKAVNKVREIVSHNQDLLFVGTKPQAQLVTEEEAKRCSMPFVTRRWLGGMLTNFATIRKSVERMLEFETRRQKNDFAGYTKKELLDVDREIQRLNFTLGGIRNMKKLPGAVLVVDPHTEKIAVHEANLLGIPVIAIADSNCDPDPVDFIIPANDDSLRSIKMFASKLADACLQGMDARDELAKKDANRESRKRDPHQRAATVNQTGKAYVARADVLESGEAVDSFSAKVEAADKAEADSGESS